MQLSDHLAVAVHDLKRTLHKFATFEKVVDVICEHCLAVHIPLYLEHELATNHAIGNLESFNQFVFCLINQIKTQHEGFLLQILVELKLEVCDVSVLVL